MTFLFFLIFEGSSQQFIPLNLWWKVVSRPANEALIVPFSLEEIWRAIKSLGKKRLLGLRRLWTFLGVLNLNGTQLEGQMDWGFSFETPFAALTCYLHISKRLSFGPIGQSTFLMVFSFSKAFER